MYGQRGDDRSEVEAGDPGGDWDWDWDWDWDDVLP